MGKQQVVISTEGDRQVHAWADEEKFSIRSVILSEGLGNYLSCDEMPDYVLDEIKEGLPGLSIVTLDKATRLQQAAVGDASEPSTTIISEGVPLGREHTGAVPAGAGDDESIIPDERDVHDKEPSPIRVPDPIQSA